MADEAGVHRQMGRKRIGFNGTDCGKKRAF